MNTRNSRTGVHTALAVVVLAFAALPAAGQVPVDADGHAIGDYESPAGDAVSLGDDGIPLRSADELEALVGPVALYPDDLLAVVLPASTYPLQVVEAARFLEDLESNPGLKPEEDWDDSIVALVNYPEVVDMLNDDLDWTWQLGEAVVAQQSDVIAAIAAFRSEAHAAGNLRSDEYQTVSHNDGDIIEIAPVSEEVIYVPYYEPERVVVRQSRPVYYYYPRAYPVYYYPYPSWYSSTWGYFWGVTTAFSIGWNTHYVNVYHPTFYGHPYYGYNYPSTWWYRRPSVVVYNNYYHDRQTVHNRYEQGDRWRPRGYTRLHYDDQRITRNRYSPNPATAGSSAGRGHAMVPGGNATRVQAAGFSGDRAQRPTGNEYTRARIRQALDQQTRAARAGTADASAGIRQTTNAVRNANTADNPARQRSVSTNVSRQPRESTTSVRDVREALAASRETRAARTDGSPVTRRTTVPQPRPAVPQARPPVPSQRQATRTWTQAPRAAAPAPAARTTSPSVPVHRAPANDSRPAASPRPASRESTPARASTSSTTRAPARNPGQRSTARPR